jgi:hypothetical protein
MNIPMNTLVTLHEYKNQSGAYFRALTPVFRRGSERYIKVRSETGERPWWHPPTRLYLPMPDGSTTIVVASFPKGESHRWKRVDARTWSAEYRVLSEQAARNGLKG